MSEKQSGFSDTFRHDSFLGWINLFKRRDQRFLIKQGERTPYPIIIDNPTLRQGLVNLNRADLGITAVVSVLGFFSARKCTLKVSSEYVRQRLFNATWTSVILLGASMGLMNSYLRLQGFVDNGLQWQRKDDKLNKYDFTSEYEQGSIWKYFRIRK